MGNKILCAARDLTGQRGSFEVSLADIAQRANVTKPPIYARWRNREAVLTAAIRDLGDGQELPREHGTGLLPTIEDDWAFLVAGPEAPFLRTALFERTNRPAVGCALDEAVFSPRRARLAALASAGSTPTWGLSREAHADAVAGLVMAVLVRAMVTKEVSPAGSAALQQALSMVHPPSRARL